MDTLSLFDPIVTKTMVFIVSIFLITTFAHFVASKLRRRKIEFTRYYIWLLFAAAMFVGAFLGGIFLALLFSFIIFQGVKEIYQAAEAGGFIVDKLSRTMTFAFACLFPFMVNYNSGVALPFLVMSTLAIFSVPIFQRKVSLASNKISLSLFALIFAGMLSHIILIRSLVGGFGFTMFVVFITDASNSMGYIFGKIFGKRKYIPDISPGKSVEGSLGSFLMAMLFALILKFWVPALTMAETMAAAILICFFAHVGDLVFSVFKREIGIKDYSKILLEQGGILDQFDSLVYTAPVFFYFLKMLEYFK